MECKEEEVYIYVGNALCNVNFMSGEAPSFISPLVDSKVDLDTTVVLECKVKGTPRPEITWMKDNVELTGDRYK